MNREIKSKKVKGYGMKYTNPCPRTNSQVGYYVGNPKYCVKGKCPFFKKLVEKDGKIYVHCQFGSI